jgi:ATP-dependent DNA ligase
VVGSLLLGHYDSAHDDATLAHIGVCASFTMARRAELLDELAPLRMRDDELAEHPWGAWAQWQRGQEATDQAATDQDDGLAAVAGSRRPGMASRWNAGKDLSWVPLRPERVVEVSYDYMEGRRFRHTAHLKRWRPDRTPRSCTFEQVDRPAGVDVLGFLDP